MEVQLPNFSRLLEKAEPRFRKKTFFIKNILLPYVNMQESHVAWDMRKALIAIIDDGDEKLEQKYGNRFP